MMEDEDFQPGHRDRLRRLQPCLLDTLKREDCAAYPGLGYGVVEASARALWPTWTDAMTSDDAQMQALFVELECFPRFAPEDSTLSDLDGAAVWVNHRASSMARSEALAIVEHLASTLSQAEGTGTRAARVSGMDGRSTIWVRACS